LIARIWRTGLDESRAEEYDQFAAERSLAMFRSQPGFCGVLFTRMDNGRAVITLWRDQDAIEALDRSADYRDTVAAIGAAGFLRSPQSVEILPVERSWVLPDLG
jgi:heme-degrading monooxygenase HmoA